MKKGDLIEVWCRTILWDSGRIRGDRDDYVSPGDKLVFLGKTKYKFIMVLHPTFGPREIHRNYVRTVEATQ